MDKSNNPVTGLSNNQVFVKGPLLALQHPTKPNEAATKGYVDSSFGDLNASNIKGDILHSLIPGFIGGVTKQQGLNGLSLTSQSFPLGTYTVISVNQSGLVTSVGNLTNQHIPAISWNKITSGKPTTLDGYGVTDAVKLSGGTLVSNIKSDAVATNNNHLVTKKNVDDTSAAIDNPKIGDIIRSVNANSKPGFLRCNGGGVLKTNYPELLAVVGSGYNQVFNPIGGGSPYTNVFGMNPNASVPPDTLTFTDCPSLLSEGVGSGQMFVTKNYLYIKTAYYNYNQSTYSNSAAAFSFIHRAPINPDGTLGAWTKLPSFNTTDMSEFMVTGNQVLGIGGGEGSTTSVGSSNANTIMLFSINSDGTIVSSGGWNTLNAPKTLHSYGNFAIIGDKIFEFANTNYYAVDMDSKKQLDYTNIVSGVTVTYADGKASGEFLGLVGKYLWFRVTGTTLGYREYKQDGSIGGLVTSITLPSGGSYATKKAVVCNGKMYLFCSTGSGRLCYYSITLDKTGMCLSASFSGEILTALTATSFALVKNKLYYCDGSTTLKMADLDAGSNDYSQYYLPNPPLFQPGSGQPWRRQYDISTVSSSTIGSWGTTGPSLTSALHDAQAIVTKDRIHILGGAGASAPVSTTRTAPINTDGSIGAWTGGGALPDKISASQAIVTNGRVHLLGGFNSITTLSTTYNAPINADGTLGAWVVGGNLPVAVSDAQAIITRDRVYLLAIGSTDTYTAAINSDGTLGVWSSAESLPGNLAESQAVVTKNRVYLLGGFNGASTVATVYTAAINSDGTLGSWSVGTSLPAPVRKSQAIVIQSRAYLIGGANGSTSLTTTYTAPINTDGTLGTWSISVYLPSVMHNSQVVVTKGRVYAIGGYSYAGGGPIITVYAALLNSSGLNDYSPYYDGTIKAGLPANLLVDTLRFNLPDLSAKETTSEYYFIKF